MTVEQEVINEDGGNDESSDGDLESTIENSETMLSNSDPIVVDRKIELSDMSPFQIAFSNENNNPIRIDSVENWYWKFSKHCVPIIMAGLVSLIAFILNPFSMQNQKIKVLEYTLKVIEKYYDAETVSEKRVYRGIIDKLKANNETAEFINNYFGKELGNWLKYAKKKEGEISRLKNQNEKLEKKLEAKEHELKKKKKDLKAYKEKLAYNKRRLSRTQNKQKLYVKLNEKNANEKMGSIAFLKNDIVRLKEQQKKINERRKILESELSKSHSTLTPIKPCGPDPGGGDPDDHAK